MPRHYFVPVRFADGTQATAVCVGKKATWQCQCGMELTGPNEEIGSADACPRCARSYRVRRGLSRPTHVKAVDQVIL